MSMSESVIVTVRCADYGIEIDLELPTGLIIKDLRGKILDILKTLYPEEFETWPDCRILCSYRVLKDDESLADLGAGDGQYLEIIKI